MKVNVIPPPARRTQAERTAATRARLLEAARRLFATKGFGEVSTQAIVDAAGVTRGALYHQFGDKTDLFAAVYEDVEAELVADVVAGSSPKRRRDRWRRCGSARGCSSTCARRPTCSRSC